MLVLRASIGGPDPIPLDTSPGPSSPQLHTGVLDRLKVDGRAGNGLAVGETKR
jgi:hypothetical protein